MESIPGLLKSFRIPSLVPVRKVNDDIISVLRFFLVIYFMAVTVSLYSLHLTVSACKKPVVKLWSIL